MNSRFFSFFINTFLIPLCFFYSQNTHAIDVIGHRGASGLAPESTLIGYKIAIEQGVDYIDMDVVMTKDHYFVVYHDLALNPLITKDRNGHWIKQKVLIKKLNLRELKSYNVGAIKPKTRYQRLFSHQKKYAHANVPTLQEVILYARKLNPTIRFQIEIKSDPEHPDHSFTPHFIVKKLLTLLNQLDASKNSRIQAFDWRCLYEIQHLSPTIITAYLTDAHLEKLMNNPNQKVAGLWTGGKLLRDYHHSIPYMIKSLGGKAWDPESHTLTEKRVVEAKNLGLQIMVWSESGRLDYDQKEIDRIRKLKIDGIITDRPDKLIDFLHTLKSNA